MKVASLVFCFIASNCFATDKEILVDVSEGITWKAMFDAGFRPHHVRDGKTKCQQTDVTLRVSLGDGEVLAMGRGDVEFGLQQGKEGMVLTRVSFFGREKRTLAAAEASSQVFLGAFRDNLTRRASLKLFGTGRPDTSEASSAARIGSLRIIHSFRSSYNIDEPLLADIGFYLKGKEIRHLKHLEKAIEPPAGYDHVSLVSELIDRKVDPDDRDLAQVSAENEERENRTLWLGLLLVIGFLVGVAVVLRTRQDAERT